MQNSENTAAKQYGFPSESRVFLIYLGMVCGTLFWAGAFIAGKMSMREFPAFTLTFLRFFFALPFIFALHYWRDRAGFFPRSGQWLPLCILGVVGTTGYHVFFFSSLKYTTAINSSLIGATLPLVTTLLAVLFLKERLAVGRWFGILLSLSGVLIMVVNADWQVFRALSFNRGDLLMLMAVLCWAVYMILSRKYMTLYQMTPLLVTAYTFLVCTIVTLPLMLWENPGMLWPQASQSAWLSVLYMAIFPSVLGYLIQLTATQVLGAPKTAIFVNLVPVFTIILSLLILREPFSLFKAGCAVLIISGVYITTRPEKAAKQLQVKQSI